MRRLTTRFAQIGGEPRSALDLIAEETQGHGYAWTQLDRDGCANWEIDGIEVEVRVHPDGHMTCSASDAVELEAVAIFRAMSLAAVKALVGRLPATQAGT